MAGGVQPRWRGDGRELFFRDRSKNIMGVSVDSTGPELRASIPARVVTASSYYDHGPQSYDVVPDGTRFLMIKGDPAVRPPNTPIVMVLNAFASPEGQGAGRRAQR